MNIIQKYNRKLAKFRLKRRYEYLIEVDKLMSEFITKTIIDGGSNEFVAMQRKQLVNMENDINSKVKLLEFLKNTK